MDAENWEFKDEYYRRKKRKSGTWEIVNSPKLFTPVADTHAHVHMLPDPGFALARAAMHEVGFVELITDPSEDGTVVFDNMHNWFVKGSIGIRHMGGRC